MFTRFTTNGTTLDTQAFGGHSEYSETWYCTGATTTALSDCGYYNYYASGSYINGVATDSGGGVYVLGSSYSNYGTTVDIYASLGTENLVFDDTSNNSPSDGTITFTSPNDYVGMCPIRFAGTFYNDADEYSQMVIYFTNTAANPTTWSRVYNLPYGPYSGAMPFTFYDCTSMPGGNGTETTWTAKLRKPDLTLGTSQTGDWSFTLGSASVQPTDSVVSEPDLPVDYCDWDVLFPTFWNGGTATIDIMSVICKMIIPAPGNVSGILNDYLGDVKNAFPFIEEFYIGVNNGLGSLGSSTSAPADIVVDYPVAVSETVEVTMIDYSFFDSYMSQIRGWITIFLWFSTLFFVYKKISHFTSPKDNYS